MSRKDEVWDKAQQIRGKNPDQYRRDPAGNQMFKGSYGKNSPQGWEVDHINPVSKGGSESLRNLQALNTQQNRSQGNSTNKPSRHRR